MTEHNEPPEFLTRMADIWEAWWEIQARGQGEAQGHYGEWKIETLHPPNGDTVMRLSIRFTSSGQVAR